MDVPNQQNLFQAVSPTVTAISKSQHVILLLENVIIANIANITIAIVLEKDGCIKNVKIIANYVYQVDCVLIDPKQVYNTWITILKIKYLN